MNSPKISIILPVYNAQESIMATSASVLSQSFSDFELIMVDDGSQDGSLPLMLSIASEDHRIKVVSQTNKGVSSARNLGVEMARAPLLAFVDSDDLWHPDKLSRHLALHTSDGEIAGSYARIAFINSNDTSGPAAKTTSSISPGCLSVSSILSENPVCTMSNLVVTKQAFEQVGPFRENMSFAEDQEWLARAASRYFPIEGIDEVLVDYRLNLDGLSVNLEKMHAGWRKLAEEYAQCQDLQAAEAIYCRYLSRRALRSGASAAIALSYAKRGMELDAQSFLQDAKRGWMTLLSAYVAAFFPRSVRLRIFA